MANKQIQTTELDFDQIKSNFKTFLQGQSEFSDYDFEGSGMSVLLDILAYNTHYNALYYNLAINEAFLDSASKRSSVVSKAKELGYIPKTATASTAIVELLMINDQIDAPATYTLSAYTPFNTNIGGVGYTFYTTQDYTTSRSGSQYIFSNVVLKEGYFLQQIFTYDGGNTPTVIPNVNIDRTTLKVTVQESVSSTNIETFTESCTVIDLLPTSLVYFMRELDNQTYQLEFGNGIIGRALAIGNIVNIDYLVCNMDAANGARSFIYNGTPPSNSTILVTTKLSSTGGSLPEDIESIRYNAPYAYTAQNRCVTAEDYRTTILSLYIPAKSVNVWGGEEDLNPQYGRVFISIVPESLDLLTTEEKDYILATIIAPRKPLSITPIIVDPAYIRIELNTTVYYNANLTVRSSTEIEDIVKQTIIGYNNENLGQFSRIFKYSKLIGNIDASEQSITSNITTLILHFEITPIYNITNQYIVHLSNPIYNSGMPEDSILSSGFMCSDLTTETCYINDLPNIEKSGVGFLRLFYVASSSERVYIKNIGTVDYINGIINIIDLEITNIMTEILEVTIKPQSNDVLGIRNHCVVIDENLLTVNSVAESATQPHIFTSSSKL
jgi:hypothetical protein